MHTSATLPKSPEPPSLGDTYEEVRLSFCARLPGEAARLATLSTALNAAHQRPAAVFTDLREFAHRLRGAAAVFEEFALSAAAKALEYAAMAALAAGADSQDAALAAAMRALAVQLAQLTPKPQG